MKANVFMGSDLDSLPVYIQENRSQYTLNLISEHNILRRRDSIIYVYQLDFTGYDAILTIKSHISSNGTSVVAYLVKKANNDLAIALYSGLKAMKLIPLDEKAPANIADFKPKILFANTINGLLIGVDIYGVDIINLYQISITGNTISIPATNSKIPYPPDAVEKPSDILTTVNNAGLFIIGSGAITLHKLNYTSNLVSSITLTQKLSINSQFGNPTALIQLSNSVLIGTDKNILKLTSRQVSSSVVFEINVAIYGVGIANKNAWYILQNMLFCGSSLGFFKFNVGIIDNQTSVYVKNINSSEDYRVKGIDSIAKYVINSSLRMFRSGAEQELIEVFFDTAEKSSLTGLPEILIRKNQLFEKYYGVLYPKDSFRFRFIFNMHSDGIYPIMREREIVASSHFTTVDLPKRFNQWVTTPTVSGVYSDNYLNADHFNKLSEPFAQQKKNKDIRLLHGLEGSIYVQLKDGKTDIFAVKAGPVEQVTENPYPIIVITSAVEDSDNSKSVQPLFSIGYQNMDGLIHDKDINTTEYLGLLIGTTNNNAPFSYGFDDSFNISVAEFRSMKKQNIMQTYSSKMGIASSMIFTTTSLVVDIIHGISVPDIKIARRHSNPAI